MTPFTVTTDQPRIADGTWTTKVQPRADGALPIEHPAAAELLDHRPQSLGPRLDALHLSGFPVDSYEHPEYLMFGVTPTLLRDTRAVLAKAKGRPEATITVYRALPSGGVQQIFEGDWVAISKVYAEEHAALTMGENPDQPMRVVAMDVPAASIRSGGNDLVEFGYWPSDVDVLWDED